MKRNGNGKRKPCAPIGSLHAEHCNFKRRLMILSDLMDTMAHEDMAWLHYSDAAQFHAATAAVSELRKRNA